MTRAMCIIPVPGYLLLPLFALLCPWTVTREPVCYLDQELVLGPCGIWWYSLQLSATFQPGTSTSTVTGTGKHILSRYQVLLVAAI